MRGLLHAKTFEEIEGRTPELHEQLGRDNFAIVRGIVDPGRVEEARRLLRDSFDRAADLRATPGEDYPMRNYQRLDVGSYGPKSNIRVRRTFSFFPWNGDPVGLRSVFQGMGRLRNLLMGTDPAIWSRPASGDALFDTPQIVQYPLGGGFISPHVDRIKPFVEEHLPGFSETHVVSLITSRRGVDFQSGGGWVQDPRGNKVDWEAMVELGDLVVYNGAARHGVDPIDQDGPFDIDQLTGRLFTICSLYPAQNTRRNQEIKMASISSR